MRITTLLGSARKKGNTATVLGWVEAELERMGHTVQRVYLNSKAIAGCLGCAKCKENPDEIACVQKDDAQDVLGRMIASDAVLYASPVYFWGFSTQLKALIDRSYALVTNYHKPGHTSLMKGKRIGLLVTGADGFEDNAEGLFDAFDRIAGFLLTETPQKRYVGGCTTPDHLPAIVKDQAAALARALVS